MKGAVDAIHAMILALASSAYAPNPGDSEARRAVMSMDAFRDSALARLEAVRDALAREGAADDRVDAVDDTIRWLRRVAAI